MSSQYQQHGKSHYQRNKAKYVARTAAKRAEIKAYIRAIKENGCCVDCGIANWLVLDFDHLPGCEKLFNIAEAPERGMSIAKLEAEISKCELRCANCHRIITYMRYWSNGNDTALPTQ